MGGEKLKLRCTAFAAAVLFAAGIAINPIVVFSQESDAGVGLPDQGAVAETVPAERPNPEADIRFDDTPNVPPAVGAQGAGSVWVMVRMVLVLALAALAIYGVVFFIKRLAKPKQALDPHLKILASAPLGTGSFAAVLSVGSKAWLVGGGDGGLSLIAEIDEQEALESMLIDDARKTADSEAGRFPDFRSLLRKLTGKDTGNSGTSSTNTLEFHAENLRKQRERLRGL